MKNQIDSNEYIGKRKLANDIIIQNNIQHVQNDWVKLKINNAAKSGFTLDTKEQILKQAKNINEK